MEIEVKMPDSPPMLTPSELPDAVTEIKAEAENLADRAEELSEKTLQMLIEAVQTKMESLHQATMEKLLALETMIENLAVEVDEDEDEDEDDHEKTHELLIPPEMPKEPTEPTEPKPEKTRSLLMRFFLGQPRNG